MPATVEPEVLVLPKPKPVLDALIESLVEESSPAGRLRRDGWNECAAEVAGLLAGLLPGDSGGEVVAPYPG